MALHHIIPKFILRGFALNPEAEKDEQEIMIYDKKLNKIYTEKINTAYAKENFNSEQTEKYLCDEFENKVAIIFQRIKKRAEDNEKDVVLSNKEYKLLFRFFTIMWRRNNIHIEKGKKIIPKIEVDLEKFFGCNYNKMKNEKYKDILLLDYFNEHENELTKIYYDMLISKTTDNDETVLKTIKNYFPTIVYNTSNIHFTLHNSYGTMNYIVKNEHEPDAFDFPMTIIEPISNNLCFCLIFCKDEIDLNKNEYKVRIENWDNNEQIKQFFIKSYITPQATSLVVDDTIIDIVENTIKGEK